VIELSEHSGIGLVRAVTDLPRMVAPEQAGRLVAEEAALLDFAKSFAHRVNGADLDAVVASYTDDCTVISPRGRYVGSDAVRQNYEHYFDPVRWFSFWTNVTVRFHQPFDEALFDEAYVSAYQYSIGVEAAEPESRGAVSTDVWRVRRSGESWQIAERRIDILGPYDHRVLRPVG
jgi:hypothetical protein